MGKNIGAITGVGLSAWLALSLTGCWWGEAAKPDSPDGQPKMKADLGPPAPPPRMKADLGEPDAGKAEGNAPALDFSGLRGVLAGKWVKKSDGSDRLEFTGKSIERKKDNQYAKDGFMSDIGKYEMKGDLLHITDAAVRDITYGLEFLSDAEIALRPEKQKGFGNHFGSLQGRWRRVSLPPGKDAAPLGAGPLADAKRQVRRIEQKVSKVESLLEATLADRDDVADKLRAVGVKSPADLKGNVRGRRLAEHVAKIAAEIDGLERQLVSLDTQLLKAKTIVRRMEREQAGLSADEMLKLSQQLRETEERTDGTSPTPTTPLDVEEAVEKALKAKPRSAVPKKPR